ncbi:TIGR02594 family protein [Sphingomonadales bacterium 58]|uniref:TIGR02594 family protein n=1 Tax=Sphingobium sp. S8 TaxID=2758385 RepID=UPI001918A4FC|nr:TIGR02594 family protein [Sphingobium sp. S8]MBY2957942.1 TIGR02594 family protein [Sphingomonadales bacterium 58]CAD7336111.1 hypothetical protein SPHS8_00855 [Sphingobium sp. S8]
MARGNRRDLYLQVSGDVGGLRTAMTAGKTIINDFSGAAINVIEEVEKEMAKLGSSGLPALKQAERAYQDTFRRIADSAREVANAPTGAAAAQILDANATREAAAAATAKATSLRLLAEAAQRADASTEGGTAATRAYAVAAATAAVNAEKEASALREQSQVLGLVERQLGTAGAAQRRTVAVSGEARAGYQQLSFQLGDIATQYAAGTSASIIFAQQSGQVIQAISLISGESKGLIGFLGGPWGIAIGAAVVALTPWVAKLLEGNDALGDAIDKLKKDAQEAEISRQAHAAYTNTLEGQIDAQRRLNQELERGLQSQRQINSAKMAEALSAEVKGKIELGKAERELAAARQASADANKRVTSPGVGTTPEVMAGYLAAAAAAEERLRKAEQAKRDADGLLDQARQNQRTARVAAAVEAAKAAVDPMTAINNRYDIMVDRATAAALANDKLAASLEKTIAGINGQREADLKAERDKQANQRAKPSLGSQIAIERSGELLTSAQRYRGLEERSDNSALQSLFKEAGLSVDPKMTAWCAAFVNAVLATNGLPGTASLGARSFLNYGTATDKPVAGDIVVAKRGTGQQGHVGFYQGTDAKGNILVFGGNTGDKVGTQAVARKDILGFRRAPTASQQERLGERAEERATRNQDEYASLLSRVQNDRLNIEQRRLVTISDIAANERQQVDLAQADIVRAAEKGVALGKWSQELADAVKLQAQQNADAEKAAITEKEQIALRQQAMDAELAQLDGQAELLQLQGQLAGTTKERRRIALELLEIESRQARVALERQLAGEQDPSRRAMLADELSRQDRNTAIKRQLVEQQNASPMDRYRQELADFDFDDELQSAQVRFFENMNDELAESATRFIKLKGVAGDFFNQMIADMIRLQIKQAMLGGGSGGILGSVLRFAGVAFGNPLSSSLTTASNNVAALESQIDYQNLRGFSSGGWTGNIGRKSIAGFVHGNEFVFDADATARIGVDTLEALRAGRLTSAAAASVPSVLSAERAAAAQPGIVRVEVASNEMFQAIVTQISGNVAAQVAASSAPAIVGLATGKATSTMSQRARRQLR